MKKISKILAIILAILMVISIIPITASAASATSGKLGDNLTWSYNTTSHILTISGYGNMQKYSVSRYPWKEYNDEILKVIISDGVTSIAEDAFCYRDSITNIVIPNGVTTIGYDAFAFCYSLESITIPDSVTTIDNRAFERCNSITEVHIPESVKSLGYGVFAGCENLKKITVDEDNPNYINDEYGVLFNKDKTTILQYPTGKTEKSYTIPNGVKIIDEYAFYGCGNLENIVIPKSVTTISEESFSYCSKLKTIDYTGTTTEWKTLMDNNPEAAELLFSYNINCIDDTIYPSGAFGTVTWYYDNETEVLTFSGEGVIPDFWDRDGYYRERPWEDIIEYKAKSIVIGDGITEIGENSFYDFSALENVTMSSVTTINDGAFAYAESLETIYMSNSIQVIANSAFYKCEKLTYIYYSGTQKEWNNVSIGPNLNDELETAKVYTSDYVVYSNYGDYQGITGGDIVSWIFDANTYTLTISGEGKIPQDVVPLLQTYKYLGMFRPWRDYTYDIKKVVIDSGITSVGAYVFRFSPNLTEVVIPTSVIEISNSAFHTCDSITDVYYAGTEEQWKNIVVGTNNESLLNANIHYNYVECEHNFDSSFVTKPSCTHYGYTTHICSICKDSYVDNFVVKPHEYDAVVTAPTCTKQGYITYTCSVCGYIEENDYTSSTGHDYQISGTVNPTCTSNGYIKYTCANGCGTTKKETTESALGHDYGTTIEIIEPTCTAKGYTKQTCARCRNVNKYDYVAALGHNYVATSTIAPNCIEKGYTIYTCSGCGEIQKDDYINATGHNYEWRITSEPTCTNNGTKSAICLVCGAENSVGVPSLGHDWYDEYEVDYAPTCTKDGQESRHCSRCDWKLDARPIPAGHHYGEWEQVDDAKCGEYGKFEHYCSLCGQIEVMSAPADHDYSIEKNVVEATCTTAGSKTLECSCGVTKTKIIPATGHHHKPEITIPATHLEEGLMTFICACGDTFTGKIEKLEKHNFESVVTAPTCTEQGYTTYTCECGDSYVEDYVNATGHSHTSEITTPATHLSEGIKTFTCTCGDTYTETIEKLEKHNYDAVVTAPTCTEQGYTTYTCECGDTYIADYIDATGHTPANAVEENYVAPTCTENGSKDIVVYCSVCDEEISRETETIEATGHADNDGDGYCDADNELLDPSVECECNCHKTGISKFFFNLILFLQKLFGSNNVCDCGVAHY